jgi:NAD(P)-dependent dehydrogenase (short-subunit alcohol dehydrogenase family)
MSNYGQAKLALILFTYELARRLEGTGVTVNALHPGLVASNFNSGTKGMTHFVAAIVYFFAGISVEKGAQTTLYLATSPQVEGVTGKYFVNQQEKKSTRSSYDQALGQRLWKVSEQLAVRS